MPISSLIVRTTEPDANGVARALETHPAVTTCEVRGADILIVTETGATSDDEALFKQFEQVEGVRAVELIYHNFEDLEEEKPCP